MPKMHRGTVYSLYYPPHDGGAARIKEHCVVNAIRLDGQRWCRCARQTEVQSKVNVLIGLPKLNDRDHWLYWSTVIVVTAPIPRMHARGSGTRHKRYRHWQHRHSQYRHRRSAQLFAPPTAWCLYVLKRPLQHPLRKFGVGVQCQSSVIRVLWPVWDRGTERWRCHTARLFGV